jgi:hypothetical protein
MGFLKSVIADARPAKSMQRSNSSPASVSGQIPAVLSSNNAYAKSASKQTHGIVRNQTQAAQNVANTRNQDASGQLSGLSNLRDNHHPKTEAQTRPEIKHSSVAQTKEVLRQQKTTNHADEPGKAVSRTTPVQSSEEFPLSKSDLPSVSIKAAEMNASSSDLARTESRPFEQNLQQGADGDFAAENMTSARRTNHTQTTTVQQSISSQTPLQTPANQQPFDALNTGLSSLPHKDEKESPSDSYESLIRTQSFANKSFNEAELSQSPDNAEDSKKAKSNREHNVDTSAQNVTLNIEAAQYPNASNNDSQQADSNPVFQATGKAESELQSSEDQLASVEARLQNIDSEVRQQKDKEVGMQVMAARTTNMIDDQLASQLAASQHSTNPVQVNNGSAEVRIGQVDVFIEKPATSSASVVRSIRPSISMASRHYLRRL